MNTTFQSNDQIHEIFWEWGSSKTKQECQFLLIFPVVICGPRLTQWLCVIFLRLSKWSQSRCRRSIHDVWNNLENTYKFNSFYLQNFSKIQNLYQKTKAVLFYLKFYSKFKANFWTNSKDWCQMFENLKWTKFQLSTTVTMTMNL